MSDYGEGQRWRFTFEGVIDEVGWLVYGSGGARRAFTPEVLGDAVSSERLPDPEPDWQPGDIAMSSDGGSPTSRRIYERVKARDGSGVWWCSGAYLYDHEVPRPLVRLVPEGQS